MSAARVASLSAKPALKVLPKSFCACTGREASHTELIVPKNRSGIYQGCTDAEAVDLVRAKKQRPQSRRARSVSDGSSRLAALSDRSCQLAKEGLRFLVRPL